jgi:outer membrane protein
MTKTLIAAVVLCACALPGLAQEGAPPRAEAARAAKLAIIDFARVSAESLMGKSYAQQIENLENEIKAEGTKKQTELQKLDAALKTLQEELEKQQSVLSAEALDRKRQEIVKKQRERQAFLEDGQAELQRMRERAQQQAESLQNEFQTKLRPFIETVAKEKGIDIILTSQVALAVTKDFDVSRDVIVKVDDAERAKPKTAPPASAAPPAPKSPAPGAPPSPAPRPSPQG